MKTSPSKNRALLLFLLLSALAFAGIFSRAPSSLWAQQVPLLADKHKSAGISCDGCHQEDPPNDKVLDATCQECHGDYAEIAGLTAKVSPNPHDSHQGTLACEICHHAHKPSEDFCAQCHSFGFKVP